MGDTRVCQGATGEQKEASSFLCYRKCHLTFAMQGNKQTVDLIMF